MFRRKKSDPRDARISLQKVRIETLEKEIEALGDRLHEMQTRLEVSQEDINRRESQLEQFFGQLSDALGQESTTAEDALRIAANQRQDSETLLDIKRLLDGEYSSDSALRARLSAAMGTISSDEADLLEAAETLRDAHARAAELFRMNVTLQQDIDALKSGDFYRMRKAELNKIAAELQERRYELNQREETLDSGEANISLQDSLQHWHKRALRAEERVIELLQEIQRRKQD